MTPLGKVTPMVFVLSFLLAGWLVSHWLFRSKAIRKPILISHRGAASLAPENTLASVSAAVDRGAVFVEVDVRRSRDGVLVLMHDRTVDRTTDGSGGVAELSWEQFTSLEAGSHFSSKYKGEHVPSLESLFKLIAKRRAKLVIEVKEPKLYPGIEEQLIHLLTDSTFAVT